MVEGLPEPKFKQGFFLMQHNIHRNFYVHGNFYFLPRGGSSFIT